MSLQIVKIFFRIVISLTICQYTQSQQTLPYDIDLSPYHVYLNGDIYNTTDAYYDDVEDDLVNKIAGGQFAKLGDFPYMAVVHQLLGNGMVGQCGGTILSKRWVLTAGHCAVNQPRRFFVVFGTIDKSGINYDSFYGSGVSMIATRAFVHPHYAEGYNDIALLHMPRDIPFSNTIQPIKLVYYDDGFVYHNAYVIGWGKDNMSSRGTKRLKYATLPIIRNEECKRFWRISDDHVCTAAGLGRDACQGDSGGPLVVEQKGQDLQIGIVSYGDAFCPSNTPGVFTRVSSFQNWIRDITHLY